MPRGFTENVRIKGGAQRFCSTHKSLFGRPLPKVKGPHGIPIPGARSSGFSDCRSRHKTRPVLSGAVASCDVAPAPVVAAKARDGCLGGVRGGILARGGGAGRRWCRCCRRHRDLCGRRTRGWGRHARVALSVVVHARDPLALLASQAASAYPGGRFTLTIHRMKHDGEDAAPAAWFRGRACATVSPESTAFLLIAPVLPTVFCCGATSPLPNRPD